MLSTKIDEHNVLDNATENAAKQQQMLPLSCVMTKR